MSRGGVWAAGPDRSLTLPLQSSEAAAELGRQRRQLQRAEAELAQLRARLQAQQTDTDRVKLALGQKADREIASLKEVGGEGVPGLKWPGGVSW